MLIIHQVKAIQLTLSPNLHHPNPTKPNRLKQPKLHHLEVVITLQMNQP
jgi:hypothetical protein